MIITGWIDDMDDDFDQVQVAMCYGDNRSTSDCEH